jgi:hypothetical protein
VKVKATLIYAGVAAGIAAIIQIVGIAQALAVTPVIESPRGGLSSVLSGLRTI